MGSIWIPFKKEGWRWGWSLRKGDGKEVTLEVRSKGEWGSWAKVKEEHPRQREAPRAVSRGPGWKVLGVLGGTLLDLGVLEVSDQWGVGKAGRIRGAGPHVLILLIPWVLAS